MADDKSDTEQGQIERAQRMRRSIEKLEEGHHNDQSPTGGKSLKEQIEERSRAAQNQVTSDSE
jgi:hypothetical protein